MKHAGGTPSPWNCWIANPFSLRPPTSARGRRPNLPMSPLPSKPPFWHPSRSSYPARGVSCRVKTRRRKTPPPRPKSAPTAPPPTANMASPSRHASAAKPHFTAGGLVRPRTGGRVTSRFAWPPGSACRRFRQKSLRGHRRSTAPRTCHWTGRASVPSPWPARRLEAPLWPSLLA